MFTLKVRFCNGQVAVGVVMVHTIEHFLDEKKQDIVMMIKSLIYPLSRLISTFSSSVR